MRIKDLKTMKSFTVLTQKYDCGLYVAIYNEKNGGGTDTLYDQFGFDGTEADFVKTLKKNKEIQILEEAI